MYKYYLNDKEYNNFWELKRDIQKLFTNTSFPINEDNFINLNWQEFGIIVKREEYISPEPTLDELKERKIQQISNNRYIKEINGYSYKDNIIDTDDRSKLLLSNCLLNAQLDPNYNVEWKCKNNQYITLNSNEIISLCRNISLWIETLFKKEKDLINMINNATTKEEIEKINWDIINIEE